MLDGLLKDIQFNNTISHGPVLLADGTPKFGTALIHSTLDMDALQPEVKEFLNKLFADKNPLSSTMIFGLNNTADYNISIPEMNINEKKIDLKLNDGIHISGTIDKQTLTGTAKGTIGNWDILADKQKFTLSASTIDMNMKGMIAGQMLGDMKFSLPSVNLELTSLPMPVSFGVDITTDTQKTDDTSIASEMTLSLANIKAPVDVSAINFNTTFKGLQIKGLEQFADIQKEMSTLQTGALNENMSEAEQQALMEKLKSLPTILTSAIQNILKKDQTTVTIKLDATSSQGKALLDLDTRYVGNGVDINLEEIAVGGLPAIMKIMEGSFNFSAPKSMIAITPAALMMPIFIDKGLIQENADQYSISTQFKGDSITLNNKAMTPHEFIALIETIAGPPAGMPPQGLEAPDGAGLPAGGIPEGLLEELAKQNIEDLKAQGLPEEIIQQVEEFKNKATASE